MGRLYFLKSWDALLLSEGITTTLESCKLLPIIKRLPLNLVCTIQVGAFYCLKLWPSLGLFHQALVALDLS
jgi:hypothetical protein